MSNPFRRCTLHKTHLEEFKRFLRDEAIAYRDGKGQYQVLQVQTPESGWQVVFSKGSMPEHYSVNGALMPLVRMFYNQRKTQNEVGAASDSACHGRSKSVRTARLGGVQMSVKRYDFDCYAFYDSARLSVNECEDGDYVLHSDYAALLARHNELVDVVAWERECECFYRWATHTCQPVTYEWYQVIFAARAEADRILSEEK